MRRDLLLLLAAASIAGCPDDPGDGDADGDLAADGDADGDGGSDADADADDGGPLPSPCAELGLPERPFEEAEDDESLHGLAADFTVITTGDDFTLSDAWTGCDVYLFLPDQPTQARGWPVGLWERDLGRLLARAPRNLHLFFVSYESTADAREAALRLLQDQLGDLEDLMPEEDLAWWEGRIHFLPTYAPNLPGWLGRVMGRPGFGVGIDRFQRIRYIGSFGDPTRYDAGEGWFAPNLSMAANEAIHYDFEAERAERLEAEAATLVPLFEGEVLSDPGWTGQRTYVEAELPAASEMAGFDALELDLGLACVGEGEYGTCPAWDYIVDLVLCDEADPDLCETEIGRWITTYHREGRWVHDITPLLPLLAGGGVRRFAFYTQQPYEVSLSLRLSSQGRGVRPVEAIPLFGGGAFGPDYDVGRDPVTVAVPADALRVEIASAITGHGGVSPGNCAEFCDTTHRFLVGGDEVVRSFPETEDPLACMEATARGAVPNQYGTWWYGRSGWCPGLEVPLVSQDVTAFVSLGGETLISYEGSYQGEPYPSEGASIVMSSWLVVYR